MTITKNKAYKIFGLSENATELKIKKAYRKLSLQCHPEKNGNSPESWNKFKELQEAYELLIDGLPNYKINFGVSEAEIERFLHEEVVDNFASPDLKDSLGVKEIISAVSNQENFQKKTAGDRNLIFEDKQKALEAFNELKFLLNKLKREEKYEITPEKSQTEIAEIFNSGGLKGFFSFEEAVEAANEKELRDNEKNWEEFERKIRGNYDLKLKAQEKITEKLSNLNKLKEEISENIERLKRTISLTTKLDTEETLLYISLPQNKICKNWLNHLFWMYGLNQDEKVRGWIEANFGTSSPIYLVKWKKEAWEEITKGEGKHSFADEKEQEEQLKKLREVKSVAEISFWKVELLRGEKDTDKYYDVLELSPSATPEQIREKYKKLSLIYHPDKGKSGDPEKFKSINRAHEVLGNEVQKAKYDLCLFLDDKGNYLNYEEWKKIYQTEPPADEEFGKKVEFVLQKELENNNLTEEDIMDYGETWEQYPFLHDQEKKMMKIRDFCLKPEAEGGKLLGIKQPQAIKYVRDYLRIINDAAENKKKTADFIEKIENELSSFGESKLTKEELNKPGVSSDIYENENYTNYGEIIKNLSIEILKTKNETKSKRLENKLNKFIAKVIERISDVRKIKNRLSAELNQKIEAGDNLLNLPENKEKVAEFLVKFNAFLASLKEQTNYEGEIEKLVVDEDDETEKTEKVVISINQEAIKCVLEEKESEISALINKLESIGENLETNEETTETSDSSFNDEIIFTPISNEEKQRIIKYLDDLVFEAFEEYEKKQPGADTNAPKIRVPRTSTSLSNAKLNVISLEEEIEERGKIKIVKFDYVEKILKSNSRETTENIRSKIIDNVLSYCRHVKGGSRGFDESENEEVKKILTDFGNLLKKEIETETGKDFADLSAKQQNLLKIEKETNNSARKLTESKRRILNETRKIATSNEASENYSSPVPSLINEEIEKESQTTSFSPKIPVSEDIHQPKLSEIPEVNNFNNGEEVSSEQHLNKSNEAEQIKKNHLAQERTDQEAHEKREREELKERQQVYDNLLKEIENSDNPEAVSLDNISYEGLGNDRTQKKLENAKKNRQDVLEREREEQERNSQIEAYDKLLGDIKNAGNSDKLKEFNEQIDDFIYDNLPDYKNKNVLKAAWSQRETELKEKECLEKEAEIHHWQDEAIDEVDEYWKDAKLNGLTKEKILTDDWQKKLRDKTAKDEIDLE